MSAAELEAANFAAAQGRSLERQAEIFGQWSNRVRPLLTINFCCHTSNMLINVIIITSWMLSWKGRENRERNKK